MKKIVGILNPERYRLDKLIKKCSKGDRRAQEQLFKLYYGYAMGITLRYSDGKESASEIVNDSFLKVFKNIESYREDSEFRAWLRRIVVNTSLDYYRKNRKYENQISLDLVSQDSVYDEVSDILDVEEVIIWLQQMPENFRVVFNLYEIEGYSHKEIADLIGMTESSSRSVLTRAKKMLRSLILEKQCHERV